MPAIKLDPEGIARHERIAAPGDDGRTCSSCATKSSAAARAKSNGTTRSAAACSKTKPPTTARATASCRPTSIANGPRNTASRSSTSTRSGCFPICVKNYGWPEAKQTFADDKALDEATLDRALRLLGAAVQPATGEQGLRPGERDVRVPTLIRDRQSHRSNPQVLERLFRRRDVADVKRPELGVAGRGAVETASCRRSP